MPIQKRLPKVARDVFKDKKKLAAFRKLSKRLIPKSLPRQKED